MAMTADRAISVSDAMALAKSSLETVRVRVVGEVSGLASKPGYKAVYFSLKDDQAVMPCLMWRDAYDASGVRLSDGQLVEATGGFTAYAPKGRLQFQVRTLTIAGEGMLRLQVAELARRLDAEGLMDPARKRPLPPFPSRIGVVTSPRGKAVHDVVRTLARRYPVAELVVAGVTVEGGRAAEEIVRGLRTVASEPGVDVIVLCRGGGSYEDLMPFNAEEVARAIVASPVPVVTGIGHEPDMSIADMVADVRASTPTAAAEAVSPDRADVSARLSVVGGRLGRALSASVTARAHRLRLVAERPVLRDPSVVLGTWMQSLDALAASLERALPDRLERQADAVKRAGAAISGWAGRFGRRERQAVSHGARRLLAAGPLVLAAPGRRFAVAAARLEDLSPLGILGRGYAVCYGEEGAVVRDAGEVAPGDHLTVRVARGTLGCVVESVGTEE